VSSSTTADARRSDRTAIFFHDVLRRAVFMHTTKRVVRHSPLRQIAVYLLGRGLGVCVLAACLFVAPLAIAQSTTADVTGTVTDNSGAILPNAKVTLTNLGTGEVRNAKTTAAGDYTFTLLNPGSYSLKVESDGFKTFVVPTVTLAASDRAREDARLEIGSTSETVQVTVQPPALQADSSVLTSTVTEKAVQDLPLNGRNYINLAQITPGANEGPPNGLNSGARPDDRRQTSAISVNGQSDVINDELVDGLDNNERIIGTIGVRSRRSTSRQTRTPPR
jgi:Carboxypeptidase regulatory-like domain